ncbi:hypothetical protein FB645_000667 [Coemansia sp. IMI 203386]|nr:hypothetical protein FB645_000667 [Coemansia sp. IMI 203386]
MSYSLALPVKGLLSRLTLDSPPTTPHESSSACSQSRSRSASHGSDATLSGFPPTPPPSVQTIDAFRLDTAVALAIRAKQLDQQGNANGAACLFVACLEHMSQALRDTGHLQDVHVRERLNMLRLLASSEPIDASELTSVIDDRHTTRVIDAAVQKTTYSAERKPDCIIFADDAKSSNKDSSGNLALSRATDNLRSTMLTAAAYGLDLLNQMVILWLLLLGNFFVWATNKFKQSDLPEISARYLVRLGSWIYATSQEWHASEHMLRAGQSMVKWMVSLDNATGFSQRMVVSIASVLAAIARVAEQSASKDANDGTRHKSKKA